MYHSEAEENYESWVKKSMTFKNLDVDWWVEPMGASHLGLAKQSILNTNSLKKAKEISEKISKEFNDDCLIVLKKGKVSQKEPIGHNIEEVFYSVGRLFDNLVREESKGIFIDNTN